MDNFLEAGIIVNAHGVRGEVRIQPWADSPAFLADFDTLYIDYKPKNVISSKIHKGFLLAALEGVYDIDSAIKLKNKIIYIKREDVQLEEGRHFITDLIGLRAIDADTCEEIGIVSDVLTRPANNVYVITGIRDASAASGITPERGGLSVITPAPREILIPAVPDFVIKVDITGGYIKFRLIDGML
jgi:16S rRNA processing protein RimM